MGPVNLSFYKVICIETKARCILLFGTGVVVTWFLHMSCGNFAETMSLITRQLMLLIGKFIGGLTVRDLWKILKCPKHATYSLLCVDPFWSLLDYQLFKSRLKQTGFEQEFSGAETRGYGATTFFDRGDASPTPALFGLKFMQKLVHCCNWLLTETQCSIIFQYSRINIDLLQTLKHE